MHLASSGMLIRRFRGRRKGSLEPLQYHLSNEELSRFFQEFPRFNPQQGYSADPGIDRGVCLAARQYCFIDAFGNVYPCLNFKSACDVEEARGGSPLARMGSVLDQSFDTIWASALIARRIRSVSRDDFQTCKSCGGSSGCNPCMALNYEESGDLFRPAQAVCSVTTAARRVYQPNFVPASRILPISLLPSG